jgi:hypothetical protein
MRTAGRSKNRWEDDVMRNLKCIQNREEWRRIVEKVKIFKE